MKRICIEARVKKNKPDSSAYLLIARFSMFLCICSLYFFRKTQDIGLIFPFVLLLNGVVFESAPNSDFGQTCAHGQEISVK